MADLIFEKKLEEKQQKNNLKLIELIEEKEKKQMLLNKQNY
jgi:hypothetical protein